MRILPNPLREPAFGGRASRQPLAFHRRLPGYRPTPLRSAPTAARRLGVDRVWVKDESERLGLPAFKILGAAWATARALSLRLGTPIAGMDELRTRLARGPRLVCATDGNHGRAVARVAAWLGLPARVYVPAGMAPARKAAIAAEGAEVVVVPAGYDAAVELAASEADAGDLVLSDTSWPGYEQIPEWVIEGYGTLFGEVEEALAGLEEIELAAVQIGVGSLAAAAVHHLRRPGRRTPLIVGVEPLDAACVLASLEAGRPVALTGPQRSIMAGLNCGRPSSVAWPTVSAGLDLALAVEDHWALEAMRVLARDGVVAGETGAAGLAGLLALRAAGDTWGELGLPAGGSVLVLVTEGATDPETYERVVGEKWERVQKMHPPRM
jgi:diaminopropionate ammonia-lyase